MVPSTNYQLPGLEFDSTLYYECQSNRILSGAPQNIQTKTNFNKFRPKMVQPGIESGTSPSRAHKTVRSPRSSNHTISSYDFQSFFVY